MREPLLVVALPGRPVEHALPRAALRHGDLDRLAFRRMGLLDGGPAFVGKFLIAHGFRFAQNLARPIKVAILNVDVPADP